MIDHASRARADILSPFLAFKPPRRVTVAQGAAENLVFKQPGGVPGNWSSEMTPYMVEPMNMLASRKHEAVVFAGPARTGKTGGLLLGWMAHNVVNDPGDMLFVQMTQDKAREFSKTDIDRAIDNSPNIKALMGGNQDDNTHDKMFRHGMWLRIAWPTVSNVSGSTYRYAAATDIDRMANAENVDGEGPLFKLMLKRVQTYGSRGMALAESSPGIPIADPHWTPATPHEAPPVTGILGLYNQSDRRRLYWKCPDCWEWFEASPGLKLFGLPDEDKLIEIIREIDLETMATEHNRVICPHCASPIGPRAKRLLNQGSRWLQDGLSLTKFDELEGVAIQSSIAGYWLGGVAAAYQSWRSIVLRYLQALRDYALTDSEESLKTTVNTDQGMPYMSKLLAAAAGKTKGMDERADKTLERFVAPDETRFLVATVDNQGGKNSRFVVQVHAIGPHREKWIIDRYNITHSKRPGLGEEFAPIDPANYPEDWDTITERVVRSTYKTSIEGREMRVRMTVVDSGGEGNSSDNAYAWYRRICKLGLQSRVMLIKGVGRDQKANFPFIKETLVGGKDGKNNDVPLYLLNTNQLKDIIEKGKQRSTPGPGFIHIPVWLPQAWWDEFNSEVRRANGIWEQVRKRNEAWDLLVYCEAGCLRLAADKIDWTSSLVPTWARPLADNSDIVSRDERHQEQNESAAANVAPVQREVSPVRVRRTARSSYLGGG